MSPQCLDLGQAAGEVRLHPGLVEALRLMNWKQAWASTQGDLHPAESSAIKVFGSEFYIEGYRLMLEVLGAHATLLGDSPGSRCQKAFRFWKPFWLTGRKTALCV